MPAATASSTTMSTQALVDSLIERYPEDADDLRDALVELQKQKLGTCERLSRISDSQWQRLGLPLGIESIIREELDALRASAAAAPAAAAAQHAAGGDALAQDATAAAAAAARESASRRERTPPQRATPPAASLHRREAPASPSAAAAAAGDSASDDDGELPLEPYEPPAEGLHRRRGGRGGGGGGGRYGGADVRKTEPQNLLSPLDLTPPHDLEQLWQQLLEDTLPPDKRPSLQDSWNSTADVNDRYMMFLEYSSYLRKPEITEEEKEERRKQLEPLMRELGIEPEDDEESSGALIWWLLIGFFVLVSGWVYYFYMRPDPLHDLQAL